MFVDIIFVKTVVGSEEFSFDCSEVFLNELLGVGFGGLKEVVVTFSVCFIVVLTLIVVG